MTERSTREERRVERRAVTSLFADVVGSTTLGEQLDPEEFRLIIGQAVDRMIRSIEQFGGSVNQIALAHSIDREALGAIVDPNLRIATGASSRRHCRATLPISPPGTIPTSPGGNWRFSRQRCRRSSFPILARLSWMLWPRAGDGISDSMFAFSD